MKRDHLAFLIGGFAFGILVGYGLFHAVASRPGAAVGGADDSGVPAPRGPMAATQVGSEAAVPTAPPSTGGAPMMARINDLKRILAADPKNVEALIELAHAYHDASMWDQAIGFYEKAVELRPSDPNLLTDLGVCYQETQKLDRALDLFRRAQTISPAHWQSLYNIVVVAGFGLARYDEAEQALMQLEKINPSAPNLDSLKRELSKAKQARG